MTSVDICVCTYRRPQLADTLSSLAALSVPAGTTLRIIVADNDVTPSAAPLVKRIGEAHPFPIRYLHCPASNISTARNACLDAAVADLIAFIDDDCTASPQWLTALLQEMQNSGADAVLGPVEAMYADGAPGWMRRGDFHSTLPVFVRGELRTGYTCNVLMRRTAPPLAGRRFDLALGRTGGEDTQFFTQMRQSGGTLAFAPNAQASEPVPAERARLSWLAKRKFRTGQTHGRLLATSQQSLKIKQVAIAGAKVAFCVAAAALFVLSPVRRNRQALRGVMHAGVVSGLIGVREIVLYGEGGQSHAA
ncbi:glycosyltransferase [Georhizobium sp. MAB10]|uniref:glycosyltransferase n=1 Tax=Georhizobium sp. MAB10 TaxID=3028319 RepID=UPI003856055F